jgi:hypothetical protein
MIALSALLLLVALACFVIVAIGVTLAKVNLIAAGLAFLTLAEILRLGIVHAG